MRQRKFSAGARPRVFEARSPGAGREFDLSRRGRSGAPALIRTRQRHLQSNTGRARQLLGAAACVRFVYRITETGRNHIFANSSPYMAEMHSKVMRGTNMSASSVLR